MKKIFIKFLPLMAAVMLATSCSKDEENNAPQPAPVQEETQNTAPKMIPFSITVKNSNSLSKIKYTDNIAQIDVTFEDTDEGVLQMKLYEYVEENLECKKRMVLNKVDVVVKENVTLTLANYENGTFVGEIKEDWINKNVYAVIEVRKNEIPVTTSSVSLIDLMKKCDHTFKSANFTLKENNSIELTDQNAYIELTMSPNQRYIDNVQYNFNISTVTLSDQGSAWIACDTYYHDGFYTNFDEISDLTPGCIYTLDYSGYVDLGFYDILWADKNLGADNIGDLGDLYAWGETEPKTTFNESDYSLEEGAYKEDREWIPTTYGDQLMDVYSLNNDYIPTDEEGNPITMPSINSFCNLVNQCHWESTTDYNGKAGYIVYRKYEGDDSHIYSTSTDPHIFFPVKYNSDNGYWDNAAMYWSCSAQNTGDDGIGDGIGLNLELDLELNRIYPTATSARYLGCYIRPIRYCSLGE